MNSPVAKPNETIARAGACSGSVGNGQEGNAVSALERAQGDETTGGGVDVVAAADKRLGHLSAVEDTAWRQHAEAIAGSLPRARKSHDRANTGGSAQYQPPSRLQRPLLPREHGAPEAADSDAPLFHRHILPKERGDGDDERRGKAVGDPPLFRRHEAPTIRITQPKQSVSEDIRRRELAAAIARGLPKRRRGRGRRPKARPDTSRDEPPRKQIRAGTRRQRRRELQAEDLASVLRFLEDEFAVKESLSNEQTWCTPIPHERKVSTVRAFYKEFHDVETLPIRTCMLCYRKRTKKELRDVTWDQWMSSWVEKDNRSPFSCLSCFPVGETFSACAECARCLRRGVLSPAAQFHRRIGCEHMFPEELKGLTPVEEKLIALNSCYGFVTRYSIASSQKQSVRYPKHIKGHITVFPNNVQELATKVLPHPLLQVMDEIHVSWQGAGKPAPSDLSSLLSVRRRVVERALVWLKKNNPHYAEIEIDAAEMESWGAPPHGVPSLVYDRMERNEPSAWEKTRTAQVVPPTERAMDDEGSVDIEEILSLLNEGEGAPTCQTGGPVTNEGNESRCKAGAEADQVTKPINEVTSSGMFPLDGPPDVADVEKLRFACDAVGKGAGTSHMGPRTWVGSSAERRRGHADDSEPYIHVSRGDEFADSFDGSFFAKTFPTLLPFGVGGPRLVEEAAIEAGRGANVSGGDMAARDLLSYPGHRISADMTVHFGPPAGILLKSETTKDLHFVGMPPGTILLTPMSVRIHCQRKRPWQKNDVSRKGLPCAAAFACTDYKVQGRTLERVALELRGTRTTNVDGRVVPSQCDPYSLYVQLSRCRTLDGIMLVSKVRERDLVGNRVPEEMTAAEARLEKLSDRTVEEALRWFD